MRKYNAERARQKAQPPTTVATDTTFPKVQVKAPTSVNLDAGGFTVSGVVGDDGSVPRVTVDGDAVDLYAPQSGEPVLGKHTRTFSVRVSATREGQHRVTLRACDAANNCVRELVVVDAATEMVEAILDRPEHKPKRGPKEEPWRVQFATEIAWVYWLRLDVEPTATQAGDAATEESAFESVLRVCFRAVGIKIKYVHRPAVDAMSRIKSK